jgi:hypothetical protein
MSTTSLIVPINVAALAVGNPDVQNAAQNLAPMADFSQLPWIAGQSHNAGPYLSAVALENATPFGGQVNLPLGIHLHWALPDGLTAGTADATSLAFPSAPNRWLVTRIVVVEQGGATATTALKSWVIESDRLTSTATAPAGISQPTVATAPVAGQPTFAYLGQAFDLATWREDATADRLTPFTALGYGHPTFASFYPNSSTVFGYYDGLTDLTDYDPAVSTISYQVCGWYSSAGDDPLAQPGATPATYGWSVADGATPTATLCSGVMGAIAWNPATQYLQAPPQPLTVAIGPSAPEALSVLMANAVQQENAEQILNALQFGLLSGSTNQINALATFEEAVHAAGFAALTGGTLWTVTKAGGTGGGEAPLPDNLGELLNELNVKQLQLNAAALAIESLQFNLFTGWYKYQLVEHNAAGVPAALQSQAAAVQSYLQNAVTAIGNAQQQATAWQGEVNAQTAALALLLPDTLTLTSGLGAPRYYQPSEPVLILSGPDVTPTRRYGYDAANGPLPCRPDTDLLTAVTLAAGLVSGSDSATLAASALPQLVAQPITLAQALLADAFLLAPSLQAAVAAAVAAQGGANNPATLSLAATVAALAAAGEALLAGQAPVSVSFVGSAPAALYWDAWAGTPWLPTLLQYDVQFAPVQFLDPNASGSSGQAYAPGFVNDNFTFTTDGIDLQYGGTLPTRQQSYQGTAILTPDATVDLANEITQFINNTGPDAELSSVLNDLQGLPILAQGLTGLTEALLMRGLTLQMPVADPLAAPPQQKFIASVGSAVADQNQVAPLPENSFNPIRSGMLTISKLRLIDVFGRFKDYTTPTVLVAKSLAPPALPGMPGGAAFLPPRLSQPSRLLFRWRAADDRNVETNDSPATSPVLGWVVPNYLDNSLLLYAPAGTSLGELALSADQSKVLFIPAPGGAYQPGTAIATVFQDQETDLANFAVGLYNGGDASFFAPFFQAVREGLTFALPQQFAENAQQVVLAGQPLALARASLALELAGQAATDESWTGFTNAVLNDEVLSDAGIGQVTFPVVLGASDQLDDTLVGYWINPADSDAYRTFYTAYTTESQGGVAPPSQSTLLVSAQGAAGQQDVVLLLDPRGSVHATTGVLPVKVIDIPPVHFASALAALELTFAVTPVLSGSNLPAAASADAGRPMTLVRPKVGAGAWSWLTTDGAAWTSTTLTEAATAQATLNYTPQHLSEGWLGLSHVAADSDSIN